MSSPQLKRLVTTEVRSPYSLRTNMQDCIPRGVLKDSRINSVGVSTEIGKSDRFEGKLTHSHVIKLGALR